MKKDNLEFGEVSPSERSFWALRIYIILFSGFIIFGIFELIELII